MDKCQPAERAPSDAARRRLSNGRALNDKLLKIYLRTDLLSRRRTNPISPFPKADFSTDRANLLDMAKSNVLFNAVAVSISRDSPRPTSGDRALRPL